MRVAGDERSRGSRESSAEQNGGMKNAGPSGQSASTASWGSHASRKPEDSDSFSASSKRGAGAGPWENWRSRDGRVQPKTTKSPAPAHPSAWTPAGVCMISLISRHEPPRRAGLSHDHAAGPPPIALPHPLPVHAAATLRARCVSLKASARHVCTRVTESAVQSPLQPAPKRRSKKSPSPRLRRCEVGARGSGRPAAAQTTTCLAGGCSASTSLPASATSLVGPWCMMSSEPSCELLVGSSPSSSAGLV